MMYYMNCGGVENAIINLIKNIDPNQFKIDLILIQKCGENLEKIPNWVNVKELDVSDIERHLLTSLSIRSTVKYGLLKKKYLETMKLFICYLYRKCIKSPTPAYDAIFCNNKKENLIYDIALDFHGYNSLTTYFIAKKVIANHKYTWVHSEAIALKLDNFKHLILEYDKIFCVSTRCVKIYKTHFPELHENRIMLFKNFIDIDDVLQKSKIGPVLPKKESQISILTVGRLSYAKGYDIAIDVAKELSVKKFNFKWYFCGDGEEKESLIKKIEEYGLENHIVLLGYKDNPYGYMKTCDIYVQPSRYEGYAVTLVEANLLNCYIISTDVSGAKEEIIEGINGTVVPIAVTSITDAIINSIEKISNIRKRGPKTINNINNESILLLNKILY